MACKLYLNTFYLFFLGEWYWSLNSGIYTCKAGTLPLKLLFQPFLLWLFCFGYFGLAFFPCCPGQWSSYLSFPLVVEWQECATMLRFFQLRWALTNFCCLGWPGTSILLISTSHMAQHNSQVPPCPTSHWVGDSWTSFPGWPWSSWSQPQK